MIKWLKKIFNINVDEINLDLKIGDTVVLKSVAENAKAGALIVVQELPVYIAGLENWDDSLLGKKVTIEGVLRQDAIFSQVDPSDEVPSQGISGAVFYIEDYRVL